VSPDAAYFLPDGDRFVPTELTRGPWSRLHQHGGPPAALLARAMELRAPELRLARMTVDYLRPVPIAPLAVKAEVLRAGRKVERMTATLVQGDEIVAHAVGVLVRSKPVDIAVRPAVAPPESPEASHPFRFSFFGEPVTYDTSVELRIARGVWGTGDVFAWMRPRVPLIAGHATSPMQRVLLVADSASGVSAIDLPRYTAINPDLTVYLHRQPEGEWIGLDSMTVHQPAGIGLADTALSDIHGPIGRALQSLVVESR
jgi:hypothetical protein